MIVHDLPSAPDRLWSLKIMILMIMTIASDYKYKIPGGYIPHNKGWLHKIMKSLGEDYTYPTEYTEEDPKDGG